MWPLGDTAGVGTAMRHKTYLYLDDCQRNGERGSKTAISENRPHLTSGLGKVLVRVEYGQFDPLLCSISVLES